ncbi:hypothetical protein [uncultured Tenacibaculum sp.]|uniref:hypothetical protein n=1 Tax=uncultured Tenacibaculum sp. TaxID=174713 RepID=UPI002627FDAE|nr:hypothetical protein [uncultured Tenacibaculum sp.]
MKNSYDQLNIEYVETKKVSLRIKYFAIFFAIIFTFIPLAELINEFDYNHIVTYYHAFGCLSPIK